MRIRKQMTSTKKKERLSYKDFEMKENGSLFLTISYISVLWYVMCCTYTYMYLFKEVLCDSYHELGFSTEAGNCILEIHNNFLKCTANKW